MADQPSFEHALESDMQALAAEIKSQRARPEMQNVAEAELLKDAIRAFPVPEGQPQAAPPPVPAPPPQAPSSRSPLPEYAANAPAEVKLEIEYLLDSALRHGLGKAMTEARKSPYFVQDAFHDALAGRLYPELQRRGIVK